jgi:hypothetical protein
MQSLPPDARERDLGSSYRLRLRGPSIEEVSLTGRHRVRLAGMPVFRGICRLGLGDPGLGELGLADLRVS